MKFFHEQNVLKAVRGSVYLLLLAPLVFHKDLLFFYTSSKAYYILAMSQVVFVLYLWLLSKNNSYAPRWNAVTKAVLIFFGVIVLTSLTGIDPTFSFWASVDRVTGVMMWMHLVGILLVISGVFVGALERQRLLVATTAVSLVVASFQFFSAVGIELLIAAVGGSTFGNSSFFSTYILFHIFFALYLALDGNSSRVKQYGWVAFALLSLALLLTPTHAAIYTFFGGLVLFGAILLLLDHASTLKRRIGQILLAVLVMAFIGVVVLAFKPGSFVYEQFVGHSTGSRFVIWDMAWQGIQERPLLGWGLENFQHVSLEFYNPCLGSSHCGPGLWFDRTHNKFLDVLVEMGGLGLVSYIAIFAAVVLVLTKQLRAKNISTAFFAMLLTVLAVHGVQTLTILDTSTTLLFWMLTLAMVVSLTHEPVMKKAIPVPFAAVGTVLGMLAFVFFVVKPVQANLAVTQVISSTNADERAVALERALNGSPQGEDIRRVYISNKVSNSLWLTPPDAIVGVESIILGETAKVTRALEETIKQSPNYLRAYLELGFLKQIEGRYFDTDQYIVAYEALIEAIDQNPSHPNVHWTLASLMIELGEEDKAVELTKAIVDQEPDFANAHIYYVISLLYAGDAQAAQSAAEEAIGLHPKLQSDIQKLLEADLETNKAFLLLQFH